jgi:hypothetical protein
MAWPLCDGAIVYFRLKRGLEVSEDCMVHDNTKPIIHHASIFAHEVSRHLYNENTMPSLSDISCLTFLLTWAQYQQQNNIVKWRAQYQQQNNIVKWRWQSDAKYVI